jgi:isopenicillin-N N-acyltransferase-like protein
MLDIVLLNPRSEIPTALTTDPLSQNNVIDGCSTFAQKYAGKVWTGQNWDWISSQKDNLVHLYIEPDGKPRCHVLTEAGLVGKIGINEWGVTVNSNAIKATDLNVGKLPVQVMLRVVLEQICREGGLEKIKELGIASVGHVSLPWW